MGRNEIVMSLEASEETVSGEFRNKTEEVIIILMPFCNGHELLVIKLIDVENVNLAF